MLSNVFWLAKIEVIEFPAKIYLAAFIMSWADTVSIRRKLSFIALTPLNESFAAFKTVVCEFDDSKELRILVFRFVFSI